MNVYLAGKVLDSEGELLPWREPIIEGIIGKENYAGPVISLDESGRPTCGHPGAGWRQATNARDAISKCDLFIAVINTLDCYNTLVEVGLAACSKIRTAAWIDLSGVDRPASEFRAVLYSVDACDRGLFSLPEFVDNCRKIISPIEWLLFGKACDFGMKLTPQFPVGRYFADFRVEDTNILIEIDGHDYHKTKEQRTHDAKREREIERMGYHVVRFTGSEVFKDPDQCLRDVYNIEMEQTDKRKR